VINLRDPGLTHCFDRGSGGDIPDARGRRDPTRNFEMQDCRFDGKVALVTGAAGGLGRQYAIDLAKRGARVMINDIATHDDGVSKAQRFAEALRAEGCDVAHDQGSLGVEADAIAAVERTVEAFGRIDILVNNAGNGVPGTAQDVTTADFMSSLQVHVLGMFWAMRQALGHMRAQDYGRIVNTGSALGAFGRAGSFPYVTSKAAIMGMTKGAALDNEDKNIRINTISPVAYTGLGFGYTAIDPRFTEEKLSVARVSPVAVFLAHEDCGFTGQTISVGGGRAAQIFTATVRGYSSDTLSCEELFAHTEQVFDPSEYFILKSSGEQYVLIPE
jgi:NAD(P)-dependent dehydrogenase (short-subunit alcohol dehydrogenase family)